MLFHKHINVAASIIVNVTIISLNCKKAHKTEIAGKNLSLFSIRTHP